MTELSKLSNYYDNLELKEEDGTYYLGTPSYDRTHWQKIPEYLYLAIVKFENDSEYTDT